MQVWTNCSPQEPWREQTEAIVGLSEILHRSWHGNVLLTTQRPAAEQETILVAFRMIREARPDITVIVGFPNPSFDTVESFHEHGVTTVWAVNLVHRTPLPHDRQGTFETIAIEKPVCPALHSYRQGSLELSVCGKRGNRLILVMAHFRRWCLADYRNCPYWLELYD